MKYMVFAAVEIVSKPKSASPGGACDVADFETTNVYLLHIALKINPSHKQAHIAWYVHATTLPSQSRPKHLQQPFSWVLLSGCVHIIRASYVKYRYILAC